MKINEIVEKHGDKFADVVEAELLKLAAEQPFFRYKYENTKSGACRYDGPCRAKSKDLNISPLLSDRELLGPECSGCIFGQALQRLGWDDKIEMSVMASISDLFIGFIGDSKLRSRLPYWSKVQVIQDTGATWSKAVAVLSQERLND